MNVTLEVTPPFLIGLFKDKDLNHHVVSGLLIAPNYVLTCAHRVSEQKSLVVHHFKTNKSITVTETDISSFSGTIDLALIHLSVPIDDGEHCATLIEGVKPIFWDNLSRQGCSAFGGNPPGSHLLTTHTGIESEGRLTREIQVMGGIIEGFSGGPIAVKGDSKWLVVAIARLGGEAANHSRIVAIDAALEAIRENRPDVIAHLTVGNATLIPNIDRDVVERFSPFANSHLRLPNNYVRREELFDRAKNELLSTETNDGNYFAVALKGPGGFGKTSLAIDLISDPDVQKEFPGIAWASVGELPELLEILRDLIYQAIRKPALTATVSDAQRELDEAFSQFPGRILVVLDDVWSENDLKTLRRILPRVTYLISSRVEATLADTASSIILIEEADDATCLTLFLASLPPGTNVHLDLQTQIQDFVITRLGRWPLLINLVSSAIARQLRKNKPLSKALFDIKERLTLEGLEDFDDKQNFDFRSEQRRKSVKLTIQLSVKQLNEEDAARYESLGIFPGSISIPITTLASLWKLSVSHAEQIALDFDDQSLLRYEAPTDSTEASISAGVRLHDVFRHYLLEHLNEDTSRVKQLHSSLIASWGELRELPDAYAWRNIAFHLEHSHALYKLRPLLTDYEWLKAKLLSSDVLSLQKDLEKFSNDRRISLIGRALTKSLNVLLTDSSQFRGQLYGRLLSITDGDIARLLSSMANDEENSWLMPLKPALAQANSKQLNTFTKRTFSRGHVVTSLSLASGVNLAIVGSDQGSLHILDLATTDSRQITSECRFCTAIAISSEGSWALTGGRDGIVRRWNLTQSSCEILGRHVGSVTSVSITPEGQKGVSSSGGRVIYWNMANRERTEFDCVGNLMTRPLPINGYDAEKWLESVSSWFTLQEGGGDDQIRLMEISNDGKSVVTATRAACRQWELSTGGDRQVKGDIGQVNTIAISDGGRWVLYVDAGNSLRMNDTYNRVDVKLNCHSGVLDDGLISGKSVAISPDGTKIVFVWAEYYVCTLDLLTGACEQLGYDSSAVIRVAVTSDGLRAVSCSPDGIRVWDIEHIQDRPREDNRQYRANSVSLSADGQRAVLDQDRRAMRIWDGESGNLRELLGNRHASFEASAVAISGDGNTVVWGEKGEVYVSNFEMAEIRKLSRKKVGAGGGKVTSLAINELGTVVVAGYEYRNLAYWNLASGETRERGGLWDNIKSIAIRAEENKIITLGNEYSSRGPDIFVFREWDLTSDESRYCHPHRGTVSSAALHGNGRSCVVKIADDKSARFWDLSTGHSTEIAWYDGIFDSISMSSDGVWIASGCWDGTIRLWEMSSGRLEATYFADGIVERCCVSVSTNGLFVVAGDNDGSIHLLKLVRGKQ